jgi:hypothetical protein
MLHIDHVCHIQAKPDFTRYWIIGSSFSFAPLLSCTPPAFPLVARIKRLNPPWSLGKLSGVDGVIFAHETSISKPGAFHGEMT